MGTSLSGLTPATTFDGLLKVGDNDPLTATLKAISTGDGTDTMLELSTSALQIGGATGMYWDNTNKRLGIGTDAPSQPFEVYGEVRFRGGLNVNGRITNSSSGKVDINNIAFFDVVTGRVGVGESIPTSRLHVKGSGNDNTTTALLVQNSAGSELFKLNDEGNINLGEAGASPVISAAKNSGKSLKLGNQAHLSSFDTIDFKTWDGTAAYTEVMRITGNTNQRVGIGETTPTAKLHIKGDGTGTADYSFKVQNAIGNNNMQIRDDGAVFLTNNRYTFNAAGGAVFKGSGATSATTSLLVQNSDGTDVLKVQDDGITTFGQDGGSGTVPAGFEFQPNPLNATWGPSIKSYYDNNKWLQIEKSSKYYTFADSGLGINMNATPTAQLQIKGSGATSATTALLVENSAGTDLLKVADDGGINFNGNIFADADYKQIGRNSSNNIRFASGETRLALQGTAAGNRVHIYSSSTATSIFSVYTQTQQVGIGNGNTALDSTAKLQVDSTTQGFLPPRMTDAERDAIATPAAGLMIYDTTNNQMNYWNGSTWIAF